MINLFEFFGFYRLFIGLYKLTRLSDIYCIVLFPGS